VTQRGGLDAQKQPAFWFLLGAVLITGASDDDPSGIATYSQAGAQFGYQLAWTMLFTYPLMVVIQEISARIGRVRSVVRGSRSPRAAAHGEATVVCRSLVVAEPRG
jgi:Mn2+/Fe2+ NRAMP family transporter